MAKNIISSCPNPSGQPRNRIHATTLSNSAGCTYTFIYKCNRNNKKRGQIFERRAWEELEEGKGVGEMR